MQTTRKRSHLGGAVRTTAFCLLFLLLFQLTSRILQGKQYAGAAAAFYQEPPGTVDVLLMGSSHMLNAVAPMQLWEEHGIAANNFAQNGQVLPVTYYALQDALRRQKPKLVVLDIYKVVQDSKIDSKASLHYTLDNMPLGLPKLSAVFDLLPAEDRAEYLLNILAYHSRWKELSAEDFQPPDITEKGAETLYTTAQPYDGWTVLPESETAPPAEIEITYLEKIAALCQAEGVDLLLVAVPFTTPEEDDLNRQAVVNGMAEWAADRGLPYLNLMHHTEAMGFDFSTDMADMYHVNWKGMEKVTRWLGSYLAVWSGLPDRRGDAAYETWNEDLAVWQTWRAEQLAAH